MLIYNDHPERHDTMYHLFTYWSFQITIKNRSVTKNTSAPIVNDRRRCVGLMKFEIEPRNLSIDADMEFDCNAVNDFIVIDFIRPHFGALSTMVCC